MIERALERGTAVKLSRPTRALIFQPTIRGPLGRILKGHGLTSNSHWLVKDDILAAPPRALKGAEIGDLIPSTESYVSDAARTCSLELFPSANVIRDYCGQMKGEKDQKIIEVREFTSEDGKVCFGIKERYAQWFYALEGLQVFADRRGDSRAHPLLLKARGEAFGVVMPYLRPRR